LGSFKTRNVLSALVRISRDQTGSKSIVAASTGNHGVAIAWAAGLLRLQSTIFLSSFTAGRVRSLIEGFGGVVILGGSTYDECRDEAADWANRVGAVVVEATNNYDVLCGAATITLEVIRELTTPFTILTSVGGGSQAAGAASVIQSFDCHGCRVIGVQASAAPAIYESWKARCVKRVPAGRTLASGLATSEPYEATFMMLLNGLSDFVLVSESELRMAMAVGARRSGRFVCGAGAAALAGFLRVAGQLTTADVVIVLSGRVDSDVIGYELKDQD
jgi:threonine dehydratase